MAPKFYVYIGNDLMRLKNLTYLFITAIYSTNFYAVAQNVSSEILRRKSTKAVY